MDYLTRTEIHVIPYPKEILGWGEDGVFSLSTLRCVINSEHEAFATAASVFAGYVKTLYGIELEIGLTHDGINLLYDESLDEGEYRLTSSGGSAVIYAADTMGTNYALSTLLQLLVCENGALLLPTLKINDAPDVDYRGLMVDLARVWHPFETLLNYADLCWIYKIHYLHLHFVDSQSYTLPSDIFPKMLIAGRYYSKDQIAELNEYVSARGIEIIPEIEVPGHARIQVVSYPELFANTPPADSTDGYVDPEIICAGKPGIMDTLSQMASEVMALFPHSRYFHIGGDEAKHSRWTICPACIEYMKEHGIDSVYGLYSDFVKRMTDVILELGRTPIVWEGFPREGADKLSRDVVVGVFESYYHLPNDLVEEGFRVINCAWQPLYIAGDLYWSVNEILAWNTYNWQSCWKKSPAHANPIQLEKSEMVLGAQICSWERGYDFDIGIITDNLAALSERTWNTERVVSAEDFHKALNRVRRIVRKILEKRA